MKLSIRFLLLIICASSLHQTIMAHPEEFHAVLKDKLQHSDPHHPKKPTRRRHLKQDVSLYLDNEPLVDLINFLAAEKEINIILPVGANAITSSVTLHLEDKVSIDEAWDILYTLLDIAGYAFCHACSLL